MHMKSIHSGGRARASGFSLLEVMIAVAVLSVGLLGMALLQAMNLRYTQSASHRTVATNLSYEALDMVRANRALRNQFSHDSFETGVVPANGVCPALAEFNPVESLARWRCQVSQALPGGESRISIAGNQVTVSIRWDDARWSEDEEDVEATFDVVTQL